MSENSDAGVPLQSHQVVIRPLVTEKGVHRASRNNQYAFEIHRDATKFDVEKAVGEHDHVHGVLHGLDAELFPQVRALLFPDAAHGELADLLPVVAEVVGGPDHLVQDHAGPR